MQALGFAKVHHQIIYFSPDARVYANIIIQCILRFIFLIILALRYCFLLDKKWEKKPTKSRCSKKLLASPLLSTRYQQGILPNENYYLTKWISIWGMKNILFASFFYDFWGKRQGIANTRSTKYIWQVDIIYLRYQNVNDMHEFQIHTPHLYYWRCPEVV